MLKPCILPAEPLILFREGIFAPGFPAALFGSQPLEGPLIALLSPRRQMGRVKTFPTKERPSSPRPVHWSASARTFNL